MRRFKDNQRWTSERYIELANTMAKAAENAKDYKGMFFDGTMKSVYDMKNSFSFWQTMVSVGMNKIGTGAMGSSEGHYKLDDYRKLMLNLWSYLKVTKEHQELWMRPVVEGDLKGIIRHNEENPENKIDIVPLRKQTEENEAIIEKLNYLVMLPEAPKSNDPDEQAAYKKAASVNYHDFIELANIMDLNNATVKLIENEDQVKTNINTAMAMIERSYSRSHQNSNISGLFYTELRNLSQALQELDKKDRVTAAAKDVAKVAASLDKLDLLATKYLDHKVDDFKENAYDKIKAAALIKNIVGFCYGVKPAIESTNNLDVETYMADYKQERIDRQNEESTVLGQRAAKPEKNVYEKAEQDIQNTKVKVTFDHTLKNAIEAKQQAEQEAAAAAPQA